MDESSRTILIRVVPRSRREVVDRERGGRLVVRTTAAPVDGSANEQVVELLAEYFGVRRRQVEIVSGHRARDKTVRITGTVTTRGLHMSGGSTGDRSCPL